MLLARFHFFSHVCVCVCVCEREREREWVSEWVTERECHMDSASSSSELASKWNSKLAWSLASTSSSSELTSNRNLELTSKRKDELGTCFDIITMIELRRGREWEERTHVYFWYKEQNELSEWWLQWVSKLIYRFWVPFDASSKFHFDGSSDEEAQTGFDASSKLLSEFLFDASPSLSWDIAELVSGDKEREWGERSEKKKREEWEKNKKDERSKRKRRKERERKRKKKEPHFSNFVKNLIFFIFLHKNSI